MKNKSLVPVLFAAITLFLAAHMANADAVEARTQTVRVNGHGYKCSVVRVNLAAGRIQPRLVTARHGIGRTDSFQTMVKTSRAVAAINGSFFDAYNKPPDNDPNMTLIRGGQVIHKGMTGTVIGFAPDHIVMGRPNFPIRGTIKTPQDRISSWYAYWINRKPTSASNITIFTPARGSRARVSDGISVIIDHDIVKKVVTGDAAIPTFGYIVHFRGNEKSNAAQFVVGSKVGFQIMREAGAESSAWETVSEGVGAGPRLLTDGKVTLEPAAEGFTEAKILTAHGQRSAIGVLKDGRILLVTAGGPTVREMADIMKQLGAVQAMNLDGGDSSNLYANGNYITRGGRELSNALVFYRP